MENKITVEQLSHAYDTRCALDDVSFSVTCGEILCFLGPNGSGKTTLFKILSTLIPPISGSVSMLGYDLLTETKAIRRLLGVVFQHTGLDPKLKVFENLKHQGHLYGIKGKNLNKRISDLLGQFEIEDRWNDFVEELSGGLQTRVEIAKALIHSPKVLLLDEPSSGLDIGIRRQLTEYLTLLAKSENILILMTTHLIEEAEMSDKVGILDNGKLVTLGSPTELKSQIEGDIILIEASHPDILCEAITDRCNVSPIILNDILHIECDQAHEFVREVSSVFPGEIVNVRIGKPTLEDVFIKLTGNPFVDGKSM